MWLNTKHHIRVLILGLNCLDGLKNASRKQMFLMCFTATNKAVPVANFMASGNRLNLSKFNLIQE